MTERNRTANGHQQTVEERARADSYELGGLRQDLRSRTGSGDTEQVARGWVAKAESRSVVLCDGDETGAHYSRQCASKERWAEDGFGGQSLEKKGKKVRDVVEMENGWDDVQFE